jgi:hypothetical protein
MSSDMPKTYSLKMLNILNINNTIEVLKIYVNKEYPEITQYLSKNYKIRALTIYTKYNIIEYTCESDIKTQELSGNCDGIKINKTYHNSQCIKLYDKEYNNESTDIVFSDNDCSYDTNYESGDGSYCSESYDIDTVISEES